MIQNYTLGRGKVYFSRFIVDTQTPVGFRYFGNTPEFSLTIESDTLDHFSSDEGIREKDDSVPLEVTRTGTFSTDHISPENISLFFFGSASVLTASAVASAPESILNVQPGYFYQLGISPTNRVGHRKINPSGFAVAVGGSSKTAGVDYNMDFDTGMIEVIEGGTIAANATLTVTYAVLSSTRDRVISGSEPVEGAMRYIAANPKGKQYDYVMPWVKITPNGDYALKGDEWQTIPFNLEALKPTVGEAIYVDGRPI
jgi:hypothetical protein